MIVVSFYFDYGWCSWLKILHCYVSGDVIFEHKESVNDIKLVPYITLSGGSVDQFAKPSLSVCTTSVGATLGERECTLEWRLSLALSPNACPQTSHL